MIQLIPNKKYQIKHPELGKIEAKYIEELGDIYCFTFSYEGIKNYPAHIFKNDIDKVELQPL